MSSTQKVWAITDLIKEIGKWKTEFEIANDIEKLNNTYLMQYLVGLIFYCNCETSVIKYNDKNRERMSVHICKCYSNITVVQFDIFEKYKRIPYYHDNILLKNNESALENQRSLGKLVLNDPLLVEFFMYDGEIL